MSQPIIKKCKTKYKFNKQEVIDSVNYVCSPEREDYKDFKRIMRILAKK